MHHQPCTDDHEDAVQHSLGIAHLLVSSDTCIFSHMNVWFIMVCDYLFHRFCQCSSVDDWCSGRSTPTEKQMRSRRALLTWQFGCTECRMLWPSLLNSNLDIFQEEILFMSVKQGNYMYMYKEIYRECPIFVHIGPTLALCFANIDPMSHNII